MNVGLEIILEENPKNML